MKVTRKNGDPITMDLIRAKSHEDGDCLIWDGGKGAGVPYIRQPGLKNLVPVRRWIAINVLGLKTDKLMASTLCGNPSCVDPNHVVMKSRSRLVADSAARTQYHKNPVRNLKLALAARARSPHSPELIERIRNMEGTHKGIARELGINFDIVNRIKNGTGYKEYKNNPWAGL
jgi:hypothetical protein